MVWEVLFVLWLLAGCAFAAIVAFLVHPACGGVVALTLAVPLSLMAKDMLAARRR